VVAHRRAELAQHRPPEVLILKQRLDMEERELLVGRQVPSVLRWDETNDAPGFVYEGDQEYR
jgi:hypothetical protein